MAVKIYNKDGEYITTMGIIKEYKLRNFSFEQEIALIKILYPEYKECIFKPEKKQEENK